MLTSKFSLAVLALALGGSALASCGGSDKNANTTTVSGSGTMSADSTKKMSTMPADSGASGTTGGGTTNMSGGSGTTNEGGMGNTGASK